MKSCVCVCVWCGGFVCFCKGGEKKRGRRTPPPCVGRMRQTHVRICKHLNHPSIPPSIHPSIHPLACRRMRTSLLATCLEWWGVLVLLHLLQAREALLCWCVVRGGRIERQQNTWTGNRIPSIFPSLSCSPFSQHASAQHSPLPPPQHTLLHIHIHTHQHQKVAPVLRILVDCHGGEQALHPLLVVLGGFNKLLLCCGGVCSFWEWGGEEEERSHSSKDGKGAFCMKIGHGTQP